MMRKKLLFCNRCQCFIAHMVFLRGIGCTPVYRCLQCRREV